MPAELRRSSRIRSAERGGEEPWEETLRRIYWVQTELADIAPYRDDGLVPNAPADPKSLGRAERRIGRRLPPSYRAFLQRFDGWTRFFGGATLLGTKDLGKRSYAALAQAAFEAAETPVQHGGPPSARVQGSAGGMIPFGIDPAGTTLFAFDPSTVDRNGEMNVVAWINEIGIRQASFSDFLDGILEFCEADRANAAAAAGRESGSPPFARPSLALSAAGFDTEALSA